VCGLSIAIVRSARNGFVLRANESVKDAGGSRTSLLAKNELGPKGVKS